MRIDKKPEFELQHFENVTMNLGYPNLSASKNSGACQRIFGALLASVLLHGLIFGTNWWNSKPARAGWTEPSFLTAKLQTLQPKSEKLVTVRQNAADPVVKRSFPLGVMRTVHQDSSGIDNLTGVPDSPPQATNDPRGAIQSNLRPLDLSPQTISQAIRRTDTVLSVAEAANRQLNEGVAPARTGLAKDMAASGIPDCLHDSSGNQAKTNSAALGGLLTLPYLAYSAVTGKCK